MKFMEKKRKMSRADKKMNHRTFAVLQQLVVIMTAAILLTACGHNKENPSISHNSYSTQKDSAAGSGEMKPQTGSKTVTDTGSADYVQASDQESSIGADGHTQSSSAANAVIKEIYDVGDSLQDGDLRITYIASGEYQEESEYLQPEAGHKYIFLEYAFENTGNKKECQLSLFAFQCFADGFAAQAYYGGEKELPTSLSAGRYAVGNIYFSVPEGAETIEVEYQPDSLSAGKVRFSYEGEKDSAYRPQANTSRTKGSFRVGDIAASDLQRILYLSCQADDRDNENVHPAEGCTYWTLTFEFENLEKEDRQISVHDFSCYADGKSCGRTLFRDDYLSADVPGGRKAKGTVTFEVPDDAQTVEVEYDTGRRSDTPVVFTVR